MCAVEEVGNCPCWNKVALAMVDAGNFYMKDICTINTFFCVLLHDR